MALVVKAAMSFRWFGVNYDEGDTVDTTDLDAHALRSLFQSEPVYVASGGASTTTTRTTAGMVKTVDNQTLPLLKGEGGVNGPRPHIDEGGCCVIGSIAYWIGGYNQDGPLNSYNPYLLRYDLANDEWLDALEIPFPDGAPECPKMAWVADSSGLKTPGISLTAEADLGQLPQIGGYDVWFVRSNMRPGGGDYTVDDLPLPAPSNGDDGVLASSTGGSGPPEGSIVAYFLTAAPSLTMEQINAWWDAVFGPEGTVGHTQFTVDAFNSSAFLDRNPDRLWGFEGGFYGEIDGKFYFGGGDSNLYDPGDPEDADAGGNGPWSNVAGRQLVSYDPDGDVWTTLAVKPNGTDYGAYGVADGKLYSISTASWAAMVPALDIYDPGTDTWESHDLADAKAAGLDVSDMYSGLQVGRWLYFPDLGRKLDLDGDPSMIDSWVDIADPLRGRESNSAVALGPDGKIWLFGGGGGAQEPPIGPRILDPVDDTWSDGDPALSPYQGVGPVYPRVYFAAVLTPDSEWRFIGGSEYVQKRGVTELVIHSDLPVPTADDSGKVPAVKGDTTGYELVVPATGGGGGTDDDSAEDAAIQAIQNQLSNVLLVDGNLNYEAMPVPADGRVVLTSGLIAGQLSQADEALHELQAAMGGSAPLAYTILKYGDEGTDQSQTSSPDARGHVAPDTIWDGLSNGSANAGTVGVDDDGSWVLELDDGVYWLHLDVVIRGLDPYQNATVFFGQGTRFIGSRTQANYTGPLSADSDGNMVIKASVAAAWQSGNAALTIWPGGGLPAVPNEIFVDGTYEIVKLAGPGAKGDKGDPGESGDTGTPNASSVTASSDGHKTLIGGSTQSQLDETDIALQTLGLTAINGASESQFIALDKNIYVVNASGGDVEIDTTDVTEAPAQYWITRVDTDETKNVTVMNVWPGRTVQLRPGQSILIASDPARWSGDSSRFPLVDPTQFQRVSDAGHEILTGTSVQDQLDEADTALGGLRTDVDALPPSPLYGNLSVDCAHAPIETRETLLVGDHVGGAGASVTPSTTIALPVQHANNGDSYVIRVVPPVYSTGVFQCSLSVWCGNTSGSSRLAGSCVKEMTSNTMYLPAAADWTTWDSAGVAPTFGDNGHIDLNASDDYGLIVVATFAGPIAP